MNWPAGVVARYAMKHSSGVVHVLGSDGTTYVLRDGDCRQLSKTGEFLGMGNQWVASFFLVDDGGDWQLEDALERALVERFDHVG